MAARTDVPPLKVFLFIPQNLIICDPLVQASELGPIVRKHPEVFKEHYDAEYLRLIAFIMMERLKGERSFWKPYFDIVNFTDLPFLWSEEEVKEFQDQVLERDIKEYKKEFDEEWTLMRDLFRANKYEEFFPGILDESKEEELK